MEAWRYSALNTQFHNLQQKLLSRMQTSKDNHSPSIEPMDSDFCNNNLTNTKAGVKRRATEDLQSDICQEKFGKRDERPAGVWSSSTCLKLDVYTQTESSYVKENYSKSLACVSDVVQANSKKLENIEKLLETMGHKFESFLMASEPASELIKIKKEKVDLTSLTHPLALEVDSGVSVSTAFAVSPNKIGGSHRDTNIPTLEDSTKSPNTCLSPELSPFASRAETPGAVNNSPGWSEGFQQGLDAAARQLPQGSQPKFMMSPGQGTESTARPFVLEAKLQPLSRELERDELGNDSDVIVPVIISLGGKSKKSVTTEVQLQDIINGTACTLEGLENVSYSHGCWLGDKNDPQSRVWYCGDTKLLYRAEASGTNPAKLSLNLLEALFSRDEMAASNINGARGRELLDPIKIKGIEDHINYKFPIEPDKEEMRWRFIKPRIDSKCRAQRRLQREQQARLDNTLKMGGSERRTRVPRIDPREKDQLLYGYSRTADLGLTTSEPQVGTGTEIGESHLSGASRLEQLQANETIVHVEISGNTVTVE